MGKLSDYLIRVQDQGIVDFVDDLRILWNNGKYQVPILSVTPTHTGRKGETVFVMAASGVFFVCTTDNSTTWRAVVSFAL